MSIDNCKFQFVEQLKAAVSIFGDGCSCIDVILGLWVVLFNGSILVVQTGRNPCKEWYKAAYSGFRYLLQILPWQINSIFIIVLYLHISLVFLLKCPILRGFSAFSCSCISGISSQIFPYFLMLFPAILVNPLVKNCSVPTGCFRPPLLEAVQPVRHRTAHGCKHSASR